MNRGFVKYLPVNPRAVEWGVYCTDAGRNSIGPGVSYPPHAEAHPSEYRKNVTRRRVLDEYQIVYITRGEGVFRCATGCSIEIKDGDVFLLFPGVWHGYSPRREVGWDEYWVGFNGPYPRLLQKRRFLSPDTPIHRVGLREDILECFFDVFDAAARQGPGFQLCAGASIIQIIAKVLSSSDESRQLFGTENIIERAKFYMEEKVYGDLDLHEVLEALSLSYSSLLKHFKDYTGLSPLQYFLQMKIARAKTLLEEGDVSVKEVAFTLGFDNQYYFSRLFHKKTGLAPSEWKRYCEGRSTRRSRTPPPVDASSRRLLTTLEKRP